MTENSLNFIDIKKDFYPIPTQVRWGETSDDEELIENFGIAFKDKIICGCCGGTVNLDDEDIYVFEELEWVDITDTIEGI